MPFTHLSAASAPPTSQYIFLSLAQQEAEGRQEGVMIKLVELRARRIMKKVKLALIWLCPISQYHFCDKTCFLILVKMELLLA